MTGRAHPHLRSPGRGSLSPPELAVLGLLAGNLISMEVWPRWDLLPLHLSFVGLTLAYCASAWKPFGKTITLVVALAGTAVVWAAERGDGTGAEQMETVLLTVVTVAVIWRTEARLRTRRLFGHLSHELLNGMTVIRGHVELLGRRAPPSNSDIERVRGVVIEEVDRMTERIDGERPPSS